MKYLLTITFKNPKGEETKTLHLKASFSYNPDTYGNGYGLMIRSANKEEGWFEQGYDLRYDTSFSENEAISYLARWADQYWSGTNGAYKLISFECKEI